MTQMDLWPTKNGSWIGVSPSFNKDHVLLGVENSPRDTEYRVMLTVEEAQQLVNEIELVIKRLVKQDGAA